MHFQLTTALLLAFISSATAQCSGADHKSCPSWVGKGYCSNTAAPLEQRKLYCGVACGLCNRDGTQTEAGGGSTVNCVDNHWNCDYMKKTKGFCTDPMYSVAMRYQYCCKTCNSIKVTPTAPKQNANCDKWSKNATIAFCANPDTKLEQKKTFCNETCEFEIIVHEHWHGPRCRAHPWYSIQNTTTPAVAAPGTPVKSGATAAGVTPVVDLTFAYVKKGCTLTLFTGDETATPPVPMTTFKDNNVANFKIDPKYKGALSYGCSCP